MIIADWHNIENNVASEVHAIEVKSKEAGIKRCIRISPAQMVPKEKKVTHTVKPYATRESREPSTLGDAKSGSLQCTRSDTLQEGRGFADFSELIATL